MRSERPRRPWHLTDTSEREYFELLGDGLVVLQPPRKTGDPAKAGWSPPTGGAWIHLGADGSVRAFTGKVEVGQGTRNALRLVVADELDLPVARIDLTLGDTDLCPWDIGTFGSRSMPDAAPALRAVAASAREVLLERAEALYGLARPTLRFAYGGVLLPGTPVPVPFSELVRGWRELRQAAAGPPADTAPGHLAGAPFIDGDASDVVLGSRLYVSDLRLPGMLYGAVLHPPRYGAPLVRVDTGKARGLPGVLVVEEPDFVGVVAQTPWQAHAALGALEAEWGEAAAPGESEIEEHLRSHPVTEDSWDTDQSAVGDPVGALSSSSVTVRATYRTAYLAHVPLEPRAALARWEQGHLTVWVGTQTPFRAAQHVTKALGLPAEEVRVIAPYTGSAFGGKHGGEIALAAALLARAAQRPVLITYTREEEFRYGYFRPMAIIDLEAGAAGDGRLTSWVFHNVNAGAAGLRTPYAVANQKVTNALADSPLPQGAYRALAATANNFARESAMDELAVQLGVDPLAFRLKNLRDERVETVLRRACERAGWSNWKGGEGRGHGLALGREKGGHVATVVEVTVSPEGAVHVDRLVTAFEAGAIVHPDNLTSQVEGASIMALGGALFEAIRFGEGRVLNPDLSGYRVPRFSDVPEVEVVLVDRRDLPSAGGGETPMLAVAPAVANAIANATGHRLRSLPLLADGKLPAREESVPSGGGSAVPSAEPAAKAEGPAPATSP